MRDEEINLEKVRDFYESEPQVIDDEGVYRPKTFYRMNYYMRWLIDRVEELEEELEDRA